MVGDAIYARVSTDEQTTETQLARLRGEAPGAQEFVDQAVSGRAARRPAFDRLLEAMRAGSVRAVYATKLDRLGRTAVGIREFFQEADRLGVRVIVLDRQVDTSTATGRFVLGLLAEIAELEVAQTLERSEERTDFIRAEHDRTGVWKTRSGKPPHRPKRVTPELAARIVQVRESPYHGGPRTPWPVVAQRVQAPQGSCRKWYADEKRRGPSPGPAEAEDAARSSCPPAGAGLGSTPGAPDRTYTGPAAKVQGKRLRRESASVIKGG